MKKQTPWFFFAPNRFTLNDLRKYVKINKARQNFKFATETFTCGPLNICQNAGFTIYEVSKIIKSLFSVLFWGIFYMHLYSVLFQYMILYLLIQWVF